MFLVSAELWQKTRNKYNIYTVLIFSVLLNADRLFVLRFPQKLSLKTRFIIGKISITLLALILLSHNLFWFLGDFDFVVDYSIDLAFCFPINNDKNKFSWYYLAIFNPVDIYVSPGVPIICLGLIRWKIINSPKICILRNILAFS